MRKSKSWIAMLLLACTLAGTVSEPGRFFATSATDKKNEAEDKLDDVNGEINDIKDNQQDINNEISATRKKLNKLLAQQEALALEIEATQLSIDVTKEELKLANEEADRQYEAMVLRIQYMYENSSSDSLWEAILQADGLADLLNRVEYVAQVHKTDRELSEQYKLAVDTVIAKQDLLVSQMDNLLAKEEIFLGQQAEVEAALADLKDTQQEFASQLAAAQKKAKELKAVIAEQERIIAEEKRKAEEERKRKEEEEKKKQEEALKKNVTGTQIVNFALKYVGNPYVWGGNSLTKGCDCSGFVHLVYKNFGINTVRYSMSFLNEGVAVNAVTKKNGKQVVDLSKLQAGDIVVYERNPKNGIGHVAIYMGNGKVVEAQSPAAGITSNRDVDYRAIAGIRRIVSKP